MTTITLRQMRYAISVASSGHFGRAAAACAVSQPALSQQILALEALCGTPLFDRLKTGVRLTPFGRDFIALAKTTVETADALDDFALGRTGRLERPLRFGLIPTVAPYLLPRIYPALTENLPEIAFAVSESRTEALLASLQDGRLDLALIATDPPPGGPRLMSRLLFDDPFVLATPRSELAATPVTLSALPPERILLLDEGHCFRDQALSACRLDGDQVAHAFAATSLATIVEFVANGQGVTLLPQIALRKEASDPRIAIHPIDDPSAGRQLRLVWREGTPYTAIFDRITDVIMRIGEPADG
ncbi:LysR family transcriptional regulator, hydrogen peroxide-inducible genes activator [Devosia lucknowensis]|uniref:LysR family transcriptional regulator, hydrogen peroxide-inducible genes activator n=1 Tax=Devosia lucknowensis TaxID=1096929 RepID=A0A1Y6FC78_9HYPH|nr:hydrogen peroxide-inducible genes activator [Devosia lucknowensis]SMQ70053.1 LysR family transcriptional regulator, hydrogen peroxide-inducible genes activator [Devosia lucknowensis]